MAIETTNGFKCGVCGEQHPLPVSYGVKVPAAMLAIPKEEWEQRVAISPDQCVIDGRDFYLRGQIPVPVAGSEEPFVWIVWAEVSPKSFVRTGELWTVEGREREAAFAGWLNTMLPLFDDSINLELSVQLQPVGRLPQFTVANADHPLAVEQREGITPERIEEIALEMFHP